MSSSKNSFSTFSGVMVPSTLAILGAVMYFIVPQIVGSVGILNTILIILLAHVITISTAFSLSSIASNINVKEGGLYYLISRSLGKEFGGSSGVLLYTAQTLSITFYAVAFARAVSGILSRFSILVPEFAVSILAFIFFAVISFFGAKKVLKIQKTILVIVLLSLISVFIAVPSSQNTVSFDPVFTIPFWVAFAMFFPAVTGISAGIGMSGELKHPRKSLIRGTFLSIGFTMIIYLLLALKLFTLADASQLVFDKHIIETVSFFAPIVVLGALVATASSVLSLSLSAPRTLRAMIKDNLFGSRVKWLLTSFRQQSKEPHASLLLTVIIGFIFLFVGELELISQILTILFLAVYSWINVAVLLEKFSTNPSYRPTFKTPLSIAIIGVLSCYVVMFLFNVYVAIGVILIQFFISFIISKTKTASSLDGMWAGVSLRFLKFFLKGTDNSKNKKNFRPIILGFSMSKKNRKTLVHIIDWISSNTSMSKLYLLYKGTLRKQSTKAYEENTVFKTYLEDHSIRLFSDVILTKNYPQTIRDTVQSQEFGDFKPNTIVFDLDESIHLKKLLPDISRLKKNIIVFRDNKNISFSNENDTTIDVWWSSQKNGNFMLLLAHLIANSRFWSEKRPVIRVFKIISSKKEYNKAYSSLQRTIYESRIPSIKPILVYRKGKTVRSIISQYSAGSDLVILGLPHFTNSTSKKDLLYNTRRYTDDLKMSLLVNASETIDLKTS
ncbi:MAG: amino acid permease [Nanobdellota archaeon]